MDKYDEVNPYESTQTNEQNNQQQYPQPDVQPYQQQYPQPDTQPYQQNYQQQYPQPDTQPYQQNFQQQYPQPDVQPYQQNYQQQYSQPDVQPYQQNFQQQYNPNVPGAYYGYQQQYSYQNNLQSEPQGSAKGLGIAGMVCGIVSIASSIYIVSGFIAGILGLIFSIISKKKSAEQGVRNSKATVGLVMSIIGLAITAFLLFCVIVYAVTDPEDFRRTLREALD